MTDARPGPAETLRIGRRLMRWFTRLVISAIRSARMSLAGDGLLGGGGVCARRAW